MSIPATASAPPTAHVCPFCSTVPRVYQHGESFYVECVTDICPTMPATRGFESREAAIAAWNWIEPRTPSAHFIGCVRRLLARTREVLAAHDVEQRDELSYARRFGQLRGILASMQQDLDIILDRTARQVSA